MSKARDIASAAPAPAGVTSTELGYVDGVTSAIQTQINTKSNIADEFSAGKNKIINGDFGVWQRGTSFTQTNGAYNADRFLMVFDGTGATRTVSQQTFTPGTAPVSGYEGQFFWRLNQSVAGTTGTYNVLQQKIEDVRTFAGQTATYSFWAKADAARTIRLDAYQYFGTGGSSPVQVVTTQTFSATTSWQRFTYTAAVPSIAGKTIGTNSFFSFEIGFPSNVVQTIDIWGVQFEAANSVSNFQTATGTKQGELAACQRYYYRITAPTSYASFGIGGAYITSAVTLQTPMPVQMRVAPTSVDFSTIRVTNTSSGWAVTALTLDTNTNSNFIGGTALTIGSSSLTVGNIYLAQANGSTSGYLGFNAEL
jgi:hypothetical protein